MAGSQRFGRRMHTRGERQYLRWRGVVLQRIDGDHARSKRLQQGVSAAPDGSVDREEHAYVVTSVDVRLDEVLDERASTLELSSSSIR